MVAAPAQPRQLANAIIFVCAPLFPIPTSLRSPHSARLRARHHRARPLRADRAARLHLSGLL